MLTNSISVLGALEPWMTSLMVGGFLIVCIAMILIVLIQRPQGGGLSGAFGAGGGGGAGQTAFGTKTGDVLTWATIGIFVLFVGFAIVLNFATRPPEPADSRPTLVTPGTPRESVEDRAAEEEAALAEDTAEMVDEVIDDVLEQAEETVEPATEPTEQPPAADPASDPSDG